MLQLNPRRPAFLNAFQYWLFFPFLPFFLFLPLFSFSQSDTIFRTFTVNATNESVIIQFTIKGGITCSGVTIQRATDSVHFTDIHEFVGVCGSLDYDESYSFSDLHPIRNQWSQYRLELGSLGIYSPVHQVRYIDYDKEGIKVFPNPCSTNCGIYFLNVSNQLHSCVLFDKTGKKVREEEIYDSSWYPNTIGFNPGMYFYAIYREHELRFSGKVLIF